jgi:hypothetical protein
MLTLPAEVTAMLALVAPLVTPSVWSHAQGLVAGAILTPGNRTGTAILSVMGLRQRRPFPNYHRVRTRARWSRRAISQTWLRGLRGGFVPPGPPVLGLDDTSERRRGKRITANGIYRAPVRSSHSHFVKASGLRWLRVLVLVPMPGVGWVWALPFLPVWAPAERYHPERRRYPQELTDWARQLLRQGRRWVPPRELRVVADRSFAMLTVLDDLRHLAQPVSMITRLRWEAALYDPAPTRRQGRTGRPRVRGTRLPTLPQVLQDATTSGTSGTIAGWDRDPQRAVAMVSETAVWDHPGRPPVPLRWGVIRDPQTKFRPQALRATDVTLTTPQIVTYCVPRWQVAVTFQAGRTHLGVETPRQWADLATARTTPPCSACSRPSRCSRLRCRFIRTFPLARPPGTPRPPLRLPTPWPWCVRTSGGLPIFHCPTTTTTSYKSLAHSSSA